MKLTAKTQKISPSAVQTELEGFKFITEPPVARGGSGEYPQATRMAVAALLNCMFTGFKSFCEARNLDSDQLELSFEGDLQEGVLENIRLRLKLPENFPDKYRPALDKVLEGCTVKKIMNHLPDFRVEF